MRELADAGMTMIVVTHEMSFARDVADHVVFIDGGVVVEEGPPSEVIDNPRQERTRTFLRRMLARSREEQDEARGQDAAAAAAAAAEAAADEPAP
jgi:polar amino acid transport system ATP-binding protein